MCDTVSNDLDVVERRVNTARLHKPCLAEAAPEKLPHGCLSSVGGV